MRAALRPLPRAVVLALGLVLAAGGLAAGCASLDRPPEPPAQPSIFEPDWQEESLREHLRFLNGPATQGRATGSLGYAQAAAYVAARLREFHLQPAFQDEFRVLYPTALNRSRAVTLTAEGPADTLLFAAGLDVLPDGRSDSGRVHLPVVVVDPDRADLTAPPVSGSEYGVLLSHRRATLERLRALRDAGARAAFIVGAFQPRVAPDPVDGLVVIQVTPRVAASLVGGTPFGIVDLLRGTSQGIRVLARSVRLEVATDRQERGSGINVLGYVPGKHPALSDELVLVCADLDALGFPFGVRTLDFEHFGTGTAALLETARILADRSRFGTAPERSVLFAVWSGGRLGHAGLRHYLGNPTWALPKIRAVVYVGLEESEVPAVQAILAPYGIPLRVIPTSEEPLFPVGHVFQPDRAERRLARERTEAEPLPEVDLQTVYDRAVAQARLLAEQTYLQTLQESITARTLDVFRVDTLYVPNSQ